MTRLFVALLCAVGIAFPIYGNEAETKNGRPNVVFFLVDDLGVMDIGAYNPNSFYETPNVDRLAGEEMRFTQGYAVCCVCSPTRFSLMTGKYPVRNACTDWFGAGRAERFRPATYHDRRDPGRRLETHPTL